MTAPAIEKPAKFRRRELRNVGKELDNRINALQTQYLHGSSAARADLARLRRALGKPAGSVPEIWHLTVVNLATHAADEADGPTVAEQAVHAALTLFALHQQSSLMPAHQPDTPFGAAAGRLRDSGGPSAAAVFASWPRLEDEHGTNDCQ